MRYSALLLTIPFKIEPLKSLKSILFLSNVFKMVILYILKKIAPKGQSLFRIRDKEKNLRV